MLGFLGKLFTGGALGTIEKIASEVIETEKESAEAKSLFIKTLDPNGLLRRDLSRTASMLYTFYLISTTVLIFAHAYGLGDAVASKEALENMTSLFTPVTTAWGAIVSASFGVNSFNISKGK